MILEDGASLENRAKKYSYIKYSLVFLETVFVIVFLLLLLISGFSSLLALWLAKYLDFYPAVATYLLITGLIYFIFALPLNIYQGYILEHKFALSNQKICNWLIDQLKSGAISYIIGLILIGAFYYILKNFVNYWWIALSLFWIFFALVLTKIMPVFIIPLFFKYRRIADEDLRSRILRLARRMKVDILDVFEIDFSKKTLKANAAFVGLGKTKRVILADTLKDKYSYDEIEVILAHEFAHYKLQHLLRLLIINSLFTMLCFYLIFRTSSFLLGAFGLNSLFDISALPLIGVYFVVFQFIMQPFQAFISRKMETAADIQAVKVTGLNGPFISMMNKLADQNLADRNPSLLIKLFFFDHPPVDERIETIKSLH